MRQAAALPPLAARSVSSAGEELPALRWLLQHGKTDDVRQVLDARYVETCRQQHFAHWLPAALPPAPATLPEPEMAAIDAAIGLDGRRHRARALGLLAADEETVHGCGNISAISTGCSPRSR